MESLEKYKISQELGHGGMATVFCARDTKLERDVALKVLHEHLQKTDEARVRFRREARSVARLEHQNIVQVYDFSDEDAERSFIAMELLSGPNLRDFVVKHGPMPVEVACACILPIASALEHAHEAGIIHRDVKPANILLHQNRTLKLGDFGIAQMIDQNSFTATGQILGSPEYMAPEQLQAIPIDKRADVFALGALFYYLLVGKSPFAARSPHQTLKRIAEASYPNPLRINGTLGHEVVAFLKHCLVVSPKARFSSMGALSDALRRMRPASDAELAAYLEDPEAQKNEWAIRAKEESFAAGVQAATNNDYPNAIGFFNRVLAFDGEHEEALAWVSKLSTPQRGRTWLWFVAASIVVLAVFLFVYLRGEHQQAPRTLATDGQMSIVDEAMQDGAITPLVSMPSNIVDASTDSAPSARKPFRVRKNRPRPRVEKNGIREVRFSVWPANVRIAIDGGAFRAFGPDFRAKKLATGRHRIRIASDTSCCYPQDFEIDLKHAETPFVLNRRLALRAAALYLKTNTPAKLSILRANGSRVSGHSRAILRLPMNSLEERVRIDVKADGHQSRSVELRISAGKMSESNVNLVATKSPTS